MIVNCSSSIVKRIAKRCPGDGKGIFGFQREWRWKKKVDEICEKWRKWTTFNPSVKVNYMTISSLATSAAFTWIHTGYTVHRKILHRPPSTTSSIRLLRYLMDFGTPPIFYPRCAGVKMMYDFESKRILWLSNRIDFARTVQRAYCPPVCMIVPFSSQTGNMEISSRCQASRCQLYIVPESIYCQGSLSG